jgi:hypothetical protein
MPSGKGMPQIMPPKIQNSGTLQRIAPCLGIHLDHWLTVIGKNVGLVSPLHPLQDFHGGLI